MSDADWWSSCQALAIAFVNGLDKRRYDETAALFTDDGVFDRWGQIIAGRNALRQWMDTRPVDIVTRHVCTNFEARRVGEDSAQGSILFTFYRAQAGLDPGPLPLIGPEMIGEYVDQFRRTPDGWRIARRQVVIEFQR
jgi:hypothetical protein